MSRKVTTEEFIKRARKVHGDFYDYSQAVYDKAVTKIKIICPIHGAFYQYPYAHTRGEGCPVCGLINKKRIYGVGIYDIPNSSSEYSYQVWHDMLKRCYYTNNNHYPSYKGCRVADEWHKYSAFKKWFDEHYIEDGRLDKDILVKGNRLYSPNTCCFVPSIINSNFTNTKPRRGKYPIGVRKIGKRFFLTCKNNTNKKSFDNAYDAFIAFKIIKEQYIRYLADKYKYQLEPKVYEALYNYKVEITD